MKINVGLTDKIVRMLLGFGIIALGHFYLSFIKIIGVILIITAVIGYCGIYSLFGINTCKIK